MPKYKIQLKQGSVTRTAHGEFKNVQAVLSHYNSISTMKVTEVLRIEFEDTTQPPIDDFNYRSIFKGFINNNDTRKSKQVLFHNIKMSVNENDIYNSCVANMEIDNFKVDAVSSTLFKK